MGNVFFAISAYIFMRAFEVIFSAQKEEAWYKRTIIVFLIALRMIFPGPKGAMVEEVDGEPFIVPLAIPLIAGPAAMATLMLFMARDPKDWPRWLAALLLAWSASSMILLLASQLARLLGKRTITAIERLMGLVLTAVAVQMLIDGAEQAYHMVVQTR